MKLVMSPTGALPKKVLRKIFSGYCWKKCNLFILLQNYSSSPKNWAWKIWIKTGKVQRDKKIFLGPCDYSFDQNSNWKNYVKLISFMFHWSRLNGSKMAGGRKEGGCPKMWSIGKESINFWFHTNVLFTKLLKSEKWKTNYQSIHFQKVRFRKIILEITLSTISLTLFHLGSGMTLSPGGGVFLNALLFSHITCEKSCHHQKLVPKYDF